MYDKWSLDVLYTGFDDEKFKKDMEKTEELILQYQKMAGSVSSGDTRENIKAALQLEEEFTLVVERLFSFCSLRQSANTSDADSVSYMGRLMQKMGDVTKASTIIEKYIAEVKDLDLVIGEDEFLLAYSDRLHRIQENAVHMLSEDVEEALTRMDVCGGNAWSDLQSFLTSSVEVDYKGEKVTLSAIRNMAYDADAAVRQEAYEAELAAYEKIKDSIAYSLNSIKLQDITVSKMRGYASPLDKVLCNSRMRRETLDALLEAMREYMPNLHGYLRAKAESLGYENGLPWYELFAPMGNNTKKYTVEESKEYLLGVFRKFNPHMAEIIDRAYEENWIDFFPRNGKVGGAFCASLNGEKQFRVLTNFDGSFSDVVTLAHELGHGYHDFMIFGNRPLNTDYSMPVAETASTFNENVVTSHAIVHAESEEEKLALLEGQLSDLTQIICDIYSRFLFESHVVEQRAENFMFAEELCKIMLDAQKEAYGNGLDPEALHPYMWACKGHYYSADLGFYNFPYAFGGLFARGLYEKYLQEGESFLEKYNQMLQETPVRSVEDAARICDIDLTKKEFWLMSLHSYDDAIAEFKRLAKR